MLVKFKLKEHHVYIMWQCTNYVATPKTKIKSLIDDGNTCSSGAMAGQCEAVPALWGGTNIAARQRQLPCCAGVP